MKKSEHIIVTISEKSNVICATNGSDSTIKGRRQVFFAVLKVSAVISLSMSEIVGQSEIFTY